MAPMSAGTASQSLAGNEICISLQNFFFFLEIVQRFSKPQVLGSQDCVRNLMLETGKEICSFLCLLTEIAYLIHSLLF